MNILWSGKYGWAHTRSQQKHSSGKFLDVRHLQWKNIFYQFQAFFMPLIGQLFWSDSRTPLVIERVIEELLSDAESQYSNISSDMFNKEKNNEAWIYTVGSIKTQQFEKHYTSLGTSINHLLHMTYIQYQAFHPDLRSYTLGYVNHAVTIPAL